MTNKNPIVFKKTNDQVEESLIPPAWNQKVKCFISFSIFSKSEAKTIREKFDDVDQSSLAEADIRLADSLEKYQPASLPTSNVIESYPTSIQTPINTTYQPLKV